MTFSAIKDKSTTLSTQVQEILTKNGYSTVFNLEDFKYYKKLCKNEFNKAVSIAQLFIDNSDVLSDFEDYIF